MCGIFGLVASKPGNASYSVFAQDIRLLFRISRERGRDASGLCAYDPAEQKLVVIRFEQDAKYALDRPELTSLLKKAFDTDVDLPRAAIGHCRLVTHGTLGIPGNNQPMVAGNIVGVHNGIITNAAALSDTYFHNTKKEPAFSVTAESWATESDTRIFYDCLHQLSERQGSVALGLRDLYAQIEGHASVAMFAADEESIFLATNTGSLYTATDLRSGMTVFASEHKFLKDFLSQSRLFSRDRSCPVHKLVAMQAARISLDSGVPAYFALDGNGKDDVPEKPSGVKSLVIHSMASSPDDLVRCTKCILPGTYPYIAFDENGVCNFCNHYTHQTVHGRDALARVLDRHRSKDGSPDCLVGLSGGRDSCYGLHILKNEFGMTPVAYTYDWGLTTDASRNNQAKICGKLGIEHIIRAPDISKKRRYIQKNIQAWLKRPSLGMVPMFVAGDKAFLHYANQLKDDLGLSLGILCAGSVLEQRDFLMGFCGINTMLSDNSRLSSYPLLVKARLASFYGVEYLRNPAYFNESFFDNLWAFYASFIFKDRSLYLFEYLTWGEKQIEDLLVREYDWETNKSFGANQWRMGDGQTAFTNYIWHTVAGFSEFDNFRSHQIREGLLSRDEALKLARADNEPKYQNLEYFAHLVGLNLDDTLARINSIPKMY